MCLKDSAIHQDDRNRTNSFDWLVDLRSLIAFHWEWENHWDHKLDSSNDSSIPRRGSLVVVPLTSVAHKILLMNENDVDQDPWNNYPDPKPTSAVALAECSWDPLETVALWSVNEWCWHRCWLKDWRPSLLADEVHSPRFELEYAIHSMTKIAGWFGWLLLESNKEYLNIAR